MARSGKEMVLVSQGLDHIMRPLAKYLGVERIISNRLDFRDGLATGRLLDPVIRPRGLFARVSGQSPDGRVTRERLVRDLGFTAIPTVLEQAIRPARRPVVKVEHSRRSVRAAKWQWRIVGAGDSAWKAYPSDRRDRIHRQGVARQSSQRLA